MKTRGRGEERWFLVKFSQTLNFITDTGTDIRQCNPGCTSMLGSVTAIEGLSYWNIAQFTGSFNPNQYIQINTKRCCAWKLGNCDYVNVFACFIVSMNLFFHSISLSYSCVRLLTEQFPVHSGQLWKQHWDFWMAKEYWTLSVWNFFFHVFSFFHSNSCTLQSKCFTIKMRLCNHWKREEHILPFTDEKLNSWAVKPSHARLMHSGIFATVEIHSSSRIEWLSLSKICCRFFLSETCMLISGSNLYCCCYCTQLWSQLGGYTTVMKIRRFPFWSRCSYFNCFKRIIYYCQTPFTFIIAHLYC